MTDRPTKRYDYCDDPTEIYRASFATIRAEADLSAVPADAEKIVVRMIHASGDTGLVADVAVHPLLVSAARDALQAGKPIFTDAEMIASGVTRRRLPADNQVHCLLHDPQVPVLARRWGTTRSAAAVNLWGDDLEGAVVAIGNAPTALFALLELISDGGPKPAAILGIPVGFVGSVESKLALVRHPTQIPYLVVHGRRGGSALCASALNALAREDEL